MKGTERFKEVIKEYLDKRAQDDALFEKKYHNEKKNLEDCISYIISEVKNSGRCGFADEEIYGMAVHYYDEENVNFSKSDSDLNVVVNHAVELTEEEKSKAREDAIRQYKDEELRKMREKDDKKIAHFRSKESKPKQAADKSNQLYLFSMAYDEA